MAQLFLNSIRSVCVTFEQSKVLSGLSPPLQISQRVVPKLHLSVAKEAFWGVSMHSGGTHGIRSTRTRQQMHEKTQPWHLRKENPNKTKRF